MRSHGKRMLHIQLFFLHYADLAHLVERHLAKVEVASSSLVIRSKTIYAACMAA